MLKLHFDIPNKGESEKWAAYYTDLQLWLL